MQDFEKVDTLRAALTLCVAEIRQFHAHAYPDCKGQCPAHEAMQAADAALATTAPLPLQGWRVEGRRWFQRGPGNTYHTVRILDATGHVRAILGPHYGYGDGYLQTAIDWLKANGHAPSDAQYGTLYMRETLGADYDVQDVKAKRELHTHAGL
jgi:hypothetical protein